MGGDDRVLTLTEAADLIGRSVQTLYGQIRRGKLQAEKHGGVYLILESEIRRYEREVMGRQGSASPSHPLRGTQAGAVGSAASRIQNSKTASSQLFWLGTGRHNRVHIGLKWCIKGLP